MKIGHILSIPNYNSYVIFYTASDETRKTYITLDNFKLIDLIGGPSVDFYIDKLSYATNIVICYIFCEKWGLVTFCIAQTTNHTVLF